MAAYSSFEGAAAVPAAAFGNDGKGAGASSASRAFLAAEAAALDALRTGDTARFLATLPSTSPGFVHRPGPDGATPLHWCALRGDTEATNMVLVLGAEVDSRTAGTLQTPLMMAALQGHVDAACALLDACADACARDSVGASALLLAAQEGQELMTLLLLDRGADVNQTDNMGCNAAHWAAYKGHASILRILRARGAAQLLHSLDASGHTPLHRAAAGGDRSVLRFLINECGMDPRVRLHGVRPCAGACEGAPDSAVGLAQAALVTMMQGANSGQGPYATAQGHELIERQEGTVRMLRVLALWRGRGDSPVWWWRVAALSRRLFTEQRLTGRITIPAAYLTVVLYAAAVWLFRTSGAVSGLTSLVIMAILPLDLWLWWGLYFGDSGALDPYGALGNDAWRHVAPWKLLAEGGLQAAVASGAGSVTVSAAVRKKQDQEPETPSGGGSASAGAGGGGAVTEAATDSSANGAADTAISISMKGSDSSSESSVSRLLRDVRTGIEEVRSMLGDPTSADLASFNRLTGNAAYAAGIRGSAAAAVLDRVCTTCGIVKPLRAKHDAVTDRCYPRYDHFCVWTGGPVTAVNHRRFLAFVATHVVSSLLSIAMCAEYCMTVAASHRQYAAMVAPVQPDAAAAAATRTPHGYNAADMPTTALGVLFYTPSVLLCLLVYCLLTVFVLLVAASQGLGALSNLTANEMVNKRRYAHFKRMVWDAATSSAVPKLHNPFAHPDSGTGWANVAELVGLRPPLHVTYRDIIQRDAADLDAVVTNTHASMVQLALQRLEAQRAAQLQGGGGGDAVSVSVSAGRQQQVGTVALDGLGANSSAGTGLGGPSSLGSSNSPFTSSSAASADLTLLSPAELHAAAAAATLPLAVIRQRVIGMRALLMSSEVWRSVPDTELTAEGGGCRARLFRLLTGTTLGAGALGIAAHHGHNHSHSHGGGSGSHGHSH